MRHSALQKSRTTRVSNLSSNTMFSAPVIAPVKELTAQNTVKKGLSKEQRVVYMAIMGVLLFATLQCVRSCVVNAYKANILISQFGAVETSHDSVALENQVLHDQINQYSSPKGLEMLARERLNLVGPHEVLINVFTEKPVVRQVAQAR